MEQIAKQQGIKWTQVPFKGSADSMNALLGGHIDVTSDSTGWAAPSMPATVRLLVTWGAKRTKSWPNVPTLQGSRHRHGVEFAVRHRRPEGHEPGDGEGTARRVQERHEGAVLSGRDGEARSGGILPQHGDYQAYAMQQIAEQKQLVEELGLKRQ